MSKTHSVTPLAAPVNQGAERQPVDTNAVLQKVLQHFSAEERSTVALRCDELPGVRGSEEDFAAAFSALLHLILQEREHVSTLFLHIHCTTEEIASGFSNGLQQYSIQFNTNINLCDDWLSQHEKQLAEVAALLERNSASLLVNYLKTTGCIFSVSVPGKTL